MKKYLTLILVLFKNMQTQKIIIIMKKTFYKKKSNQHGLQWPKKVFKKYMNVIALDQGFATFSC